MPEVANLGTRPVHVAGKCIMPGRIGTLDDDAAQSEFVRRLIEAGELEVYTAGATQMQPVRGSAFAFHPSQIDVRLLPDAMVAATRVAMTRLLEPWPALFPACEVLFNGAAVSREAAEAGWDGALTMRHNRRAAGLPVPEPLDLFAAALPAALAAEGRRLTEGRVLAAPARPFGIGPATLPKDCQGPLVLPAPEAA